ncbi:hydrogenase 4 subunit F [Candidatus Kaiserbacteria bacterium]|nr:hydrogenase 4 subunit F [Candidatus Kaiserbacteria bacterium]
MLISLLLATPLVSAGLSALVTREQKRLLEYGAVLSSLMQVAFVCTIGFQVLSGEVVNASSALQADALGAFAILFISVVGFAAAMHSVGHLREEVQKGTIGFRRVRQYFVLYHLFFLAMYAAAVSASPLLTWITVEATTLASVFLITFYGKASALEAGWKFLIINSVGLLFGFLGSLLFLSAAAESGASETFITWDVLRSLATTLDPTLIKVAFVFVLVGFGTKVGFVPMHPWLPDAHSNAPIPISGLLSGVLLNIALIGILRFRAVADLTIDPAFSEGLLLGFGIISLVVATLIMFVQRNYKRLLAYSSIEHMGFMAIGFGLGGGGALAALFHMLYHALIKSVLFFAAGNFFLRYGTTKIAEIRGAISTLPVSASIFLIGLFLAAGLPPSGIFFTEMSILSSALQASPFLACTALIALLLAFTAFLKYGSAMLFSEPPAEIEKGEHNYWTLASIALLFFIFVVISIHIPRPLYELVEAAAAIIR